MTFAHPEPPDKIGDTNSLYADLDREEKVKGPFGVAEASASVVELCETAKEMLEEVRGSFWWQLLMKKSKT